jgi:hypothetical protein
MLHVTSFKGNLYDLHLLFLVQISFVFKRLAIKVPATGAVTVFSLRLAEPPLDHRLRQWNADSCS